MSYQPKTGAKCSCRRGVQRDNCPNCEGTGWVINFAAIRARAAAPELLAAAEEVAAQLQRAMSEDATEADFEGCVAMRDELLVAIAKAKGEQ